MCEIGVTMMSRYGRHSLIAAYGIDADKIVFIPHGVNIPDSRGQARRLTSLETNRHVEGSSFQDLSEIVHNLNEAGKCFLILHNNVSLSVLPACSHPNISGESLISFL